MKYLVIAPSTKGRIERVGEPVLPLNLYCVMEDRWPLMGNKLKVEDFRGVAIKQLIDDPEHPLYIT